jgi:endonuclease YncB( thermonuclease family)
MIVLAVVAAVGQVARESTVHWPSLGWLSRASIHPPRLPRASLGPPPPSGPALSGRARVIDGDSLEIAGEQVRLFGIDAPESRQECRDAAGRRYACGRAAARALVAATAGRTVTCTPVDHDRYDRDIALCAAEGRDLGEAMVRAGHAVELSPYSGGRYAAAERAARAARRGVWAGTFEAPSDWRRRHGR